MVAAVVTAPVATDWGVGASMAVVARVAVRATVARVRAAAAAARAAAARAASAAPAVTAARVAVQAARGSEGAGHQRCPRRGRSANVLARSRIRVR